MEINNDANFTEAFDELAKSYEDPSRTEPSFEDFVNEPEDSSVEDDENVSQTTEMEVEAEADVEPTPVTTPEPEPVVDLPLDYKELYEKTRRDAEAQNKLWAARLGDLSSKYNELKEAKQQPKADKADQEELPENVKELFEIHPEIADAVKTLIEQKVSAVKGTVESELKPLQQHIMQNETDRHLSTIRAAHPDLNAIMDSGDLVNWIDSLPPVMQNGAKYVYQYGSANEVVSLLNDYKTARGVLKSAPVVAPNPAVAAPAQTDAVVKQVLAALAVRTDKEPLNVGRRQKSFDDVAREFERTQRTR